MLTKRRILAAATLLSLPFGVSYVQAATQPAQQTAQKVKKASAAHQRTSIGSPQSLASVPKIRTKKARDASGDSGESVIVTGTHAFNRKARDSSVPVTVLSSATLRRSGQLNLADAITRVDPSITVTANGADAGALTSAIRMRGLNPNEVLVLVDGKRRHTTANIYADAGPQQGSTPVDLNMIPAGAIDHIEILRDGAAALYGSDAIAGVVNVITKKPATGSTPSPRRAPMPIMAMAGSIWSAPMAASNGAMTALSI